MAGIDEYWIVDPQGKRILVLKRDGERYAVHGEFTSAQSASSALLPGFEVDVSKALGAK
jgi:Uma2 family endonuclease